MDSPSARSLELPALLRSGREWTAHDLAARLRVGERTVRRDGMRLRGMGYDVSSRPGTGAVYALRPSMRIPPRPHERRAFPWDSIEDWLSNDFGASGARPSSWRGVP
jgi:hypothetical protein